MISNFVFHRVSDNQNGLWPPMNTKLFEKCIYYIQKKFHVVLFEDLVQQDLMHFSPLSNQKRRIATIMFDDGYKDNIEYAVPILKKYNLKASFYVITNCIDKNIPTWDYNIEWVLKHTKRDKIILNFDFIPKNLQVIQLTSIEKRLFFIKKLKPLLKKLSHDKRNQILKYVFEKCNDVESPKLMMNWNDLRCLKSEGHYIGSHSVNHSILGNMLNIKDLTFEIQHSGYKIQEKLGHFPITFSYPFGSYNDLVKKIIFDSGYKIGLATKQDVYKPYKDNLLEIPRIELYNESWSKTLLRISNILEKIKYAVGYKIIKNL